MGRLADINHHEVFKLKVPKLREVSTKAARPFRFADNQTAVIDMLQADGNEVRLRATKEAAP